jgi:ribulose kinase
VLGAAVFAAVAAGRLASVAEGAQAFYRPGRGFVPREEASAQYHDAYAAYRQAMERLYPGSLEAHDRPEQAM